MCGVVIGLSYGLAVHRRDCVRAKRGKGHERALISKAVAIVADPVRLEQLFGGDEADMWSQSSSKLYNSCKVRYLLCA